MAVTENIGAPSSDLLTVGRCGLMRIFLCEAAVAAPVTTTTLYGVQSYDIGNPSEEINAKVFHIGGGHEYRQKRMGFTYPISITMLDGYAFQEVEKFYNRTFDSSNDAFIPFDPLKDEDPQVIIELIVRQDDTATHLGSVLFADMIIDPLSFSQGLDQNTFTINGYTKRPPGLMPSGTEVVYDQFSGDGSATDQTLSSTPLTVCTASLYHNLHYNELLYVKEKATGESTGTIQTSGYSNTGTTLTADTAPAASTTIQALYIKATA